MAPFINWSQLCGAALNFLFIISVHNRAVFRHDKCVRIIFQDNRSQMADFILGNQNVEDVNRLLQFTVLSGRHSVLERPLSAAKRPLILTDCR